MPDPASRPSVYIETTVVSLLVSRSSRDLLVQANQVHTHEWWASERPAFDLFTSNFTVDEAGGCDATAASDRLAMLRTLPLVPITLDVTTLSQALIAAMSLPPRARTDAAHVAVCAVNNIDYLLTWNCTHLANAALAGNIERTCAAVGFTAPRIVTPMQLKATP